MTVGGAGDPPDRRPPDHGPPGDGRPAYGPPGGGAPLPAGLGPGPMGSPGPGAGAPATGDADDSRAEQVLSQALRAMAGGQSAPSTTGGRATLRLSTGQLVLLAAIVGLLVGIGAGLLSLML